MDNTCAIALKEWAVVVDALAAGDQLILLRKGGIEDVGGEFRLEAHRFCLWPTYLHQDTDWLRDEHAGRLAETLAARPDAEDDVLIAYDADVADILVVPERERLDRLAAEHLWSDDYLDMRWRYRPELPLYLLILRVHELVEPILLTEQPAQRGCRSWVPFEPAARLAGHRAVVDDAAFERRTDAIRAALA